MTNTRAFLITAISLLGAALLLGLLVQLLPWKSASFSGGGFGSASIHETLWGTDVSGGGQSQSKGWYASSFDSSDGILMVRIVAPLVLASVLGLAAGGALMLLRRVRLGSILAGAFGLALLVCTILFNIGLDQVNNTGGSGGSGLDTGAGTQMAYLAVALALGGAVFGFLASQGPAATPSGSAAPSAPAAPKVWSEGDGFARAAPSEPAAQPAKAPKPVAKKAAAKPAPTKAAAKKAR